MLVCQFSVFALERPIAYWLKTILSHRCISNNVSFYFDFIYSPDVYTVCNCLQYLSDFLNLKSNKGHLRLNWSDTERLAKELDGMETELNFFFMMFVSQKIQSTSLCRFYFSFARLSRKFTSTTRIEYFYSHIWMLVFYLFW